MVKKNTHNHEVDDERAERERQIQREILQDGIAVYITILLSVLVYVLIVYMLLKGSYAGCMINQVPGKGLW